MTLVRRRGNQACGKLKTKYMQPFNYFAIILLATFLQQCKGEPKKIQEAENMPATNPYPELKEASFEAFDPGFWELIPKTAGLEILADGHDWTEGPVWVEADSMLLYSDIPRNAIYRWKEGEGSSLYLKPSGFMGEDFKGEEPGSNGLLLDANGKLLLCQHGERRLARMKADLVHPKAEFEPLAATYQGKRFNSPNDAVLKSDGALYFTDPPYGLPGQADDPGKELEFQGVYRLGTDGEVTLLTRELSRPNGLAFSPDEQRLYVSNSDPEQAIWKFFDVSDDGLLENGRVLYDVTERVPGNPGLPDGMTVDTSGHLFATGPGGVYVFNGDGKALGVIHTGQATANCTFNEDQSTLFITADSYLLRLRLK